MKFRLKRTALAVHRALPFISSHVLDPLVLPHQKDETPIMKTKIATTKIFLKKHELNVIADQVFAGLQAEGKEPPYNRRGVNLESFFWNAAKSLLPADRVPHSLSEYIRIKLVAKLNYRLKKQLIAQTKAPVIDASIAAPAAQVIKPTLTTDELNAVFAEHSPIPPDTSIIKPITKVKTSTSKAAKSTIVVEHGGFKATFNSSVQAAFFVRRLMKKPQAHKPYSSPKTSLSIFIKNALEVNGTMFLSELIDVAQKHNMIKPGTAPHKVIGMAMVTMSRSGDVKKLDNGSWTL